MTQKCRLIKSKNKTEWLENRKSYITATDTSSILGENKYKDYVQLMHDKIYGSEFVSNEHIVRGTTAEPFIISAWCAQHKAKAKTSIGLVASIEYPWLGCTPDAIARRDGRSMLLEVKCPQRVWKQVPRMYLYQVYQQMIVTGRHEAKLIAATFDMKLFEEGKPGEECVGPIIEWDIKLTRRDAEEIVKRTKSFFRFYQALRQTLEAFEEACNPQDYLV